MRSSAQVFLMGLLCFALAAASSASAATEAADEQSAYEHFSRGLKLVDERAFVEAAVEFRRAYELRPHPATLFNLGMALAEAQEPTAAAAALERFLEQPAAPSESKKFGLATQRLASLRARLAVLAIEGGTPEIRVAVDDEPLGAPPLRHWVLPGVHRIVVESPAMPARIREVSLAAGETTRIVLEAPAPVPAAPVESQSRIRATCPLAEVKAELDGAPMSLGQPVVATAGAHRVRFIGREQIEVATLLLTANESAVVRCTEGLLTPTPIAQPTAVTPTARRWRAPVACAAALVLAATAGGVYLWNNDRYHAWVADHDALLASPAAGMPDWEHRRSALNDRRDSIIAADRVTAALGVGSALALLSAGILWWYDSHAGSPPQPRTEHDPARTGGNHHD